MTPLRARPLATSHGEKPRLGAAVSRRAWKADALVERNRAGVEREWRDLRQAVRGEVGVAARGLAWAAAVGGLALGLELARRWFERSGGRLES